MPAVEAIESETVLHAEPELLVPIFYSFKVVDARIDARPGSSRLVLRDSSFDTSFVNDKPASIRLRFPASTTTNQRRVCSKRRSVS